MGFLAGERLQGRGTSQVFFRQDLLRLAGPSFQLAATHLSPVTLLTAGEEPLTRVLGVGGASCLAKPSVFCD